MYKTVKHLALIYIAEMFPKISEAHPYQARSSMKESLHNSRGHGKLYTKTFTVDILVPRLLG